MGIRVDKDALLSQLEKAGCPERAELPFQKAIIEEKLPYTIGGGIGQSCICMFFFKKSPYWRSTEFNVAGRSCTGSHCTRNFFIIGNEREIFHEKMDDFFMYIVVM